MSVKELTELCIQKDEEIEKYSCQMYGKNDIMRIYGCESNKALRILKLIFQIGKGNKIGREYYVSRKNHDDFLRNYQGKEVLI
jgi:hypothetical protein